MADRNLTFDLTGKVAVVTGGGGVLCSGFSKTLAAAGAKVAVCDLRKEAAQAVADEIVAAGGVAIAVGMNVLDADSVRAARDEIVSSLGDVDLLLNGAGGNNPKGSTTKDNLTPEDMESIIAAVSEKEAETTVKYAPVTDESGGTVVFWTESGKVWHVSRECPSLKKSTNIKSGNLTDAETAGKKKSCSVCGKGATK